MKYLVSLLTILSLTLSSRAHAQFAEPRDSLRTLHAYGPDLSFQRRVGQLMLIGGLTSTAVHFYATMAESKLAGYVLYAIYRDTAFPMAIVGSMASWTAVGVGAFILALSPAPVTHVKYTDKFRTAAGFPEFMSLTEGEQLAYMRADRELAAFVHELAERAAQTRPLPARP